MCNNLKKGWNTGTSLQEAHNCSYSPKTKSIILSQEVYAVIVRLCHLYEIEWQMLLSGRETEDKIYITGYYIPKQEITTASVKNLDCIDHEFIAQHNIVAGIHSHGSMGTYFSPTDEQHTNASIIKTHLLVNNKLEFNAVTRMSLPCGMVKGVKAEVKLDMPEVNIVGLDNITEVVPNVTVYRPHGYPHEYPNNWNNQRNDNVDWNLSGGNKKKKRKKHFKGGVLLTNQEIEDLEREFDCE